MIRNASPDDLGRLEQLWLYSVITAHPSLPRDYWRARLAAFRRDCLDADYCLVYTERGHRSADGFALVAGDDTLKFLCVTPALAGHGAGAALMEATKRACPQLQAHLLQENLLGRYFLQRHGFVETERYADGDSGQMAIVMLCSSGCVRRAI
ncbi:GNAT family N-acetyltransferase [Microbulbifer sp. SAOS-129_SWC]|uniref:GNAT family N-acetyltransferase n=1 Tax=Microbulbifer sp. SAOS-129_SWC TaxID=3145235 RepID=UPI0032165634